MNTKTNQHPLDYNKIRAKLVSMQDMLEKRLQAITKDITHAEEPPEKDFAEQAVERENEEVLEALGSAAREELIKIKRALKRIADEEYGYCVDCGESIQLARLEAIPFSDKCIKCASKSDN